jgi:exonuclease III
VKLTDVLDQMDFTDIYRTLHPKIKQYTFFSALHDNVSKIDYLIRHKTNINRYKKIEIISYMLLDHQGLIFKNNKNNRKPTHSWKIYNSLLNINQCRNKVRN